MPILSINEFADSIRGKAIAGIDPGKKRVGIAVCDAGRSASLPICIIERNSWKEFVAKLRIVFHEYGIKGAIIGNPIHMSGSESLGSQGAKDFAINISDTLGMPVCLWDERLSTSGAMQWTIGSCSNIDAHAAAFILDAAVKFICREHNI